MQNTELVSKAAGDREAEGGRKRDVAIAAMLKYTKPMQTSRHFMANKSNDCRL